MKFVGLRHEIRLAIDFDQHADFATEVDVGSDDAFGGVAVSLFDGGGDALFAEQVRSDGLIAIGFKQRAFAVHQPGARFRAQFVDHCSSNVSHGKNRWKLKVTRFCLWPRASCGRGQTTGGWHRLLPAPQPRGLHFAAGETILNGFQNNISDEAD